MVANITDLDDSIKLDDKTSSGDLDSDLLKIKEDDKKF